MITIAVCDDRKEVLDEICPMIADIYGEEAEAIGYVSPKDLIHVIKCKTQCVDIVIMDIELNRENGIEAAKEIFMAAPEVKIIFMTGHIRYAQDIFQVEPLYFLIKPISRELLQTAVDKAIKKMGEQDTTYITFQSQNNILKIRTDHIMYVESDKRLLYVHKIDDTMKTYMKLDEFIDMVPPNFLRSHKSYAVNMDRIQHFSSEGILLSDGRKVPVSRPKYREAKEKFLQYAGEKVRKMSEKGL